MEDAKDETLPPPQTDAHAIRATNHHFPETITELPQSGPAIADISIEAATQTEPRTSTDSGTQTEAASAPEGETFKGRVSDEEQVQEDAPDTPVSVEPEDSRHEAHKQPTSADTVTPVTSQLEAMETDGESNRAGLTAGDSIGPAAESVAMQESNKDHIDLDDPMESVMQSTNDVLEGEATQPVSAAQAPIIPPPNPGAAVQIAPAIEPDTDSTDEAYAESIGTSYVTSIASEVSKGIMENGRLYPSYGKHGYGLPTDEDEMDRLDLQHHKYKLVIGNKHFLAPIGPTPQRILDLATGTGIWALDVADMFPTAQVTGVDIAPIQPAWVAINCQFELDDIEEPWTYRKESFDFIHGRDFLYCLRDYPKLMRQCYEHLKPGGYVELACIYPLPFCDDGSTPMDNGFRQVCEKFMEASALWGTPADAPTRYAQYMRDAGFIDVSENVFKVPSCPWPKDKVLKQIGALEMTNVVEGAQGFGLRVFEKVFGWTKEQTELVMVNFRRDVKNRSYHQYCQ